MEVAALSLLLLLNCLDSGSAKVSLTVTPERSQFFKFDHFSVSCEEEEQTTKWSVMKMTEDREVHQYPSSCSIIAAFPTTDTGQYWCKTGLGETSDPVNITVTAGSVILESPVHPVMEGEDVTLSCRSKITPDYDPSADFYKDGLHIGMSATGNLTLYSVSRSDEGLYKCNRSEISPESWLVVRAPPAGQDTPAFQLPLVRHLVVGTPYLLSTIILGLIYRDRVKAQHASKARRMSNDVIIEIAA
ncbi:low affinity immunoglobulin gamma Fc region receptor III-like isoform X2 [Micropterus salmoides]|uniref:low affinity immunoglobulin gamma Fc region receptor III-like n=1 Tax=Micropterus salmoides TaxID=27706 RepID=UPI0018ED2E87|nr:low affinity immunoglobulin gamma Fc region receptor III-like [Micropterus salmoides]XP_038588554.1 low affinity immunoglobulin gamma Fc region receptor III-like isoform X2 [Micropterus salmoides]